MELAGPTPLLSIIMPTRNRAEYAKAAIRSVLGNASPVMQLAVEDNSDSDELQTWIRVNVSDSRLVYRYSAIRASMAENYDRAMALASGDYICFIGDDDGVGPEIVDAARWARDNDLDALVPTSVVNYVWPDLQMTARGAIQGGELVIRRFSGERTWPVPGTEMLKCARDAGLNFHKLPKAYYGIVRRKCFDRVKEVTGRYFPGISPDMAAALAVAHCANRVCHVDYPLFVPGSSAQSNAGLGGLKRHIGWLRDQPHLPVGCETTWSDIVPAFYSVQTIWAEATVDALRATGRADVLKHFNVPKLYAACFIFHHQHYAKSRKGFYRALRSVGRPRVIGTVQVVYWFIHWWMLRARSLLLRLTGPARRDEAYRQAGLQDIGAAVSAVTDYLRDAGRHFAEPVR